MIFHVFSHAKVALLFVLYITRLVHSTTSSAAPAISVEHKEGYIIVRFDVSEASDYQIPIYESYAAIPEKDRECFYTRTPNSTDNFVEWFIHRGCCANLEEKDIFPS